MADNTPLSYLDFSAQIKAKYPAYQGLDDLTLAQKVVEKYPVYAEKVNFFRDPTDVLPSAKSAAAADEYSDPTEQRLFQAIYSQPEPPELAKLHQAALVEKNNAGFFQRHFGRSPAQDAYAEARNKYEDQLQAQFDKGRIQLAAGPQSEGGQPPKGYSPTLGALPLTGPYLPNQIMIDTANQVARERYEQEQAEKNNPINYMAEHPVKAAYEGAVGGVSPVGTPEEYLGVKGYYHLGKGIYQAATAPDLKTSFEHGTEAVEGLGETLNPLMYTMGGLNPETLIKYSVGQKLASGLAEDVAERAGLSPEAQQFIGATSGILGGVGLGLHEHLAARRGMEPAPDTRSVQEQAKAATETASEPQAAVLGVDAASRPMPGTTPVVENGQAAQAPAASEPEFTSKKIGGGIDFPVDERIMGSQMRLSQLRQDQLKASTPEEHQDVDFAISREQQILTDLKAKKASSTVLSVVDQVDNPVNISASEQPPAPREPMSDQPSAPAAGEYVQPLSAAKQASIEEAKDRAATNRIAQLRNIKTNLDATQAELANANRALKTGASRGARTPEQMQDLQDKVSDLKDQYLSAFRLDAKHMSDEEAQDLISKLEEPNYEKTGKVIQLNQMLTHDPAAKFLRRVLREDSGEAGLSQESIQGLQKMFPDEQIGRRLTKGKNGLRTQIYNTLGFEDAPEPDVYSAQFNLLKFVPKGDKAEAIMANVEKARAIARAQLEVQPALEASNDPDFDPKRKEMLENLLARHEENVYAPAEQTLPAGYTYSEDGTVTDRNGNQIVKGATSKEDATKKAVAVIQAENKKIGPMSQLMHLARKIEQTGRTETVTTDKQGNVVSRQELPQITNLRRQGVLRNEKTVPEITEAIRNYATKEATRTKEQFKEPVEIPKAEPKLLARKGDYKHLPILATPKVRADAINVPEESPSYRFAQKQVPGEFKEITAKNLQDVMGKKFNVKEFGRLTPEQREQLKALPEGSPDRMALREGFVRDRVAALRDKLKTEVQHNYDRVQEIKKARGIKGLSPFETAYDRMMKAGFEPVGREKQLAEPTGPEVKPEAPVVQTPEKVSAPAPAQEKTEAPVSEPTKSLDKDQVSAALDELKKLDKKSLTGIRNELGMKGERNLTKIAEAVVRSSQEPKTPTPEAQPQPPKPPLEAPPAEEAKGNFGAALEAHKVSMGLEKEISKLDPAATIKFTTLRKAAEEVGGDRVGRYSLYQKGLETYLDSLKKGNPWGLKDALDVIRKPEQRGSIGMPGKRGLSPQEIQDSYRAYANVTLDRYERMTDLQVARMRDKINDGVLERAVKESKDPSVLQRFEALRDKAFDTDPVASIGSALINGVEVTPAEAGKGIMRERMGEQKLDKIRLRKELDDYAKRWDKASINESVAFIDAIEQGGIDRVTNKGNVNQAHALTGQDKVVAEKLALLLDDRMIKVKALGEGFFDKYLENYFPHIWSNVGKARDVVRQTILARKPLAGTNEFLKKREYDTFRDGLAAGLQPLSWNPVKITLARIEQIDKFLAAHKMKQDFIKEGLVKFFRAGADVPRDWVKLDDSIFRAEKRDKQTGAIMRFGDYYAPKELATAFNNHLSPGLSGNKVFDIVRQYGNAVNQSNLIGGVFHLIESGFNTTVSDLALSLQQATTKGQRLSALKSLGRMPVSVIDAYFNSGRKMMAEAASPGTFQEYARSVDAMSKAGGSLTIDPQYLNQSMEKLRTSWKTAMDQDSAFKTRAGAVLRVGANAVGSVLEKSNWFVMEHFVPRMKAATFHRMAEQISDKMGPNPNQTLLRMELDKAWDSVDNRLGELIYDNLFWNRMAKDAALVTFRSTGWNLGTVREIGGGSMDLGKNLYELAKGRKTQLSARSAYTIALTGAVMGIGAGMTYFATGHAPQSLTDYFYPPDGTTGPDGKPNRHYLKSYVHDVNSMIQHPLVTTAHKLSPLWSQAAEVLWNNADYYGREIIHPGDSILQDAKNLGKYGLHSAAPFFYQNYQEEQRRDATTSSKLEALFGILPAPKWAGQTKAEKLAYDLAMRSMPQGPRDQEAFDRSQEVGQLRNKYANKNASITDMVKEAQEGKIRYSDINNIVRESGQTPLERHLSRLSAKDALQVWDAATPEEKAQIQMSMLKKYSSIYKDYGAQDLPNLQQRFLEILKFQQQKKTAGPGGAP